MPVIAKSDTLTDDEITEYRALLRAEFDRARIAIVDFDAARVDGRFPPPHVHFLFELTNQPPPRSDQSAAWEALRTGLCFRPADSHADTSNSTTRRRTLGRS